MPKTTDPTFWQSPAYSLRGKNDFPIYVSSPGPVYRVDRTTRHGRYTTAKVDMGMVLDRSVCTNLLDKQINIVYILVHENIIMSYNPAVEFNVHSPGPAAYLPCYPNLKRAPTPKLLLPLTDGERSIGPSPNAYTLSGEHRSSIKSRRKGYTM